MPFAVDIAEPAGDERTLRRVALNQATLRSVNQAVRGPRAPDVLAFRCECGRIGCNDLIALRPREYEAVRAHPRRFAVVPGHEVSELEDTVEHHPRYAIVEARAPVAVTVAEPTARRDRRDDPPR